MPRWIARQPVWFQWICTIVFAIKVGLDVFDTIRGWFGG